MTTCPHDDATLQELGPARAGGTPPWRCLACFRCWWPAELTPAARGAWDKTLRCLRRNAAGQAARAAASAEAAQDFLDRRTRG